MNDQPTDVLDAALDRRERVQRNHWTLPFGAEVLPNEVRFRLWAPAATRVELLLVAESGDVRRVDMEHTEDGYRHARVQGLGAGVRYRFDVDGIEVPDPAARSLPDGVHGAAEVIAADDFAWSDDDWCGLPTDELIIYELHVGTFTQRGTFDAAIRRLDDLVELGITAVELMPIGSFPGARNWGYDGVAPFAPFAGYGGPAGLKRFVDAAHRRRIAVILDVVYNHLGPDGNYLSVTSGGQLFNRRRPTSWGDAINFDCEGVRSFYRENALYWAHEYHVDGLRLDATHAIVDESRTHILREITDALHGLDRPRFVIAEDDRNDRRLLQRSEDGGYGFDAVWADDLHHELVRRVTGENEGYFQSYSGSIEDIARTLRQGWFFEGQWSSHHDAPRGTAARGIPPKRFIHCIQNHDQVGNRAQGDRLHERVSAPVYRALSALLLLSPYTPLLWMGQEWCASTPFQFFTNFGGDLGRAVSEGRRRELADFSSFSGERESTVPDPEAESTFLASRLAWAERAEPRHARVLELYRELLQLRRHHPAFSSGQTFAAEGIDDAVVLSRTSRSGTSTHVVVNFAGSLTLPREHPLFAHDDPRQWRLLLSTEASRYSGSDDTISYTDSDGLVMAGAGAAVLHGAARP